MKHLELGALHITRVQEGENPMPLSMAFQGVQPQDLARLKPWSWDPFLAETPEQAMLLLSVHSFVLRVDGLNILIDSCNGNHKQRSLPFVHMLETDYLQQLERTGVRAEDIDIVMCTHLHADHVGWNTRLENGQWVPTFPKARYLFGRTDYEFFSNQTHEAFHREAYEDSVLPIVAAGRAELVESDMQVHREIGNGIWLESAAGQSPGNLCIHAERGGDRAIFSGDCFHHPLQLVRPDLHFFADERPEDAAAVRLKLFKTHADTNAVFFPAHFAGRTAGRVKRAGESFEYDYL